MPSRFKAVHYSYFLYVHIYEIFLFILLFGMLSVETEDDISRKRYGSQNSETTKKWRMYRYDTINQQFPSLVTSDSETYPTCSFFRLWQKPTTMKCTMMRRKIWIGAQVSTHISSIIATRSLLIIKFIYFTSNFFESLFLPALAHFCLFFYAS